MEPLFSDSEFAKAKSKEKLPLKCKGCDSTFYAAKHRIKESLLETRADTKDYCSNECHLKHNHPRGKPPLAVYCHQCKKEFYKNPSQIKKTKHHFCSRSCAAKYNNTHKTKGTRISKLEVWLQEQLPILFPALEFHFNRKDAINSELDIYIPSLKLAFELNGIFHYEPIFGPEKLSSIQNNDERKMQACLERRIELCILDVSGMKYFKPAKAQKFLDIITNIIRAKING